MNKIVTFPIMGNDNTQIIKESLENLGLKILLSPVSKETIKLGVKYCPDMSCIPMKICLGQYIQALDKGANILLSFDTFGECRFRQYHTIHRHLLEEQGYKFEMYVVSSKNILSVLKKLTGKSKIIILNELIKMGKKLQKLNENHFDSEKINIGIIGELFCSSDESTNYNIIDRIKKLDCNPYNSSNISEFIDSQITLGKLLNPFKIDEKKKFKKQAKEILGDWKAGHCYENLYNMFWMKDKIDGLIHIFPLCCMPDSTIEPFVNSFCKENKIPLLRIYLDENMSEANLDTRLETFVELIRRKHGNKN